MESQSIDAHAHRMHIKRMGVAAPPRYSLYARPDFSTAPFAHPCDDNGTVFKR